MVTENFIYFLLWVVSYWNYHEYGNLNILRYQKENFPKFFTWLLSWIKQWILNKWYCISRSNQLLKHFPKKINSFYITFKLILLQIFKFYCICCYSLSRDYHLQNENDTMTGFLGLVSVPLVHFKSMNIS